MLLVKFEGLQREPQSIYESENPIHSEGFLMWLTGVPLGKKKGQ